MNLYKLSVILQDSTIERGVWADDMIISERCYMFRNMGDNQYDIVASYPVDRTFIYSIETEAQVEETVKRMQAEPKITSFKQVFLGLGLAIVFNFVKALILSIIIKKNEEVPDQI